jgi:hypothetical protein
MNCSQHVLNPSDNPLLSHGNLMRNTKHVPHNCFTSTLHALTKRPHGCLRRTNLAHGDIQPTSWLPIYAMVVPLILGERMEILERRLAALGSPSVTFIECANREDVGALSAEERACVHPRYFRIDLKGAGTAMSNGTLSLALKHAVAFLDVVHRNLPAAMVLEDDAMVPASLWRSLSGYYVPCDASIFWLSAYRQNLGVFAMRSSSAAQALPSQQGPTVYHRLENVSGSGLLSTAGYIIFARGAISMLTHPVYAPADIGLACMTPQCMGGVSPADFELGSPRGQYGPATWLFGQNNSAGHGGSHYRLRVR